MSQQPITRDKGLRHQIFHDDPAKGLRGVTLLKSSGPRGTALYVTGLTPEGKRQQLTSYSLAFQDFHMQWQRAIDKLARYYGIEQDSDLYNEMAAAWPTFAERYNLEFTTVYYANVKDAPAEGTENEND